MKQWKIITGSASDFEGAPEWATVMREGYFSNVFFENNDCSGKCMSSHDMIEKSYDFNYITHLPIIAQRELIEMWDGEGLPPVGTICQWDNGENDWCNVKIIGVKGDEVWVKPLDGSQSFVVCDGDFKPLLDERHTAINEILQIIDSNGVDPLNLATQLYDAGWRKHGNI